MAFVTNILSIMVGIYMLLIFIRVLVSWFSAAHFGLVGQVLTGITDPYINWFHRFPALRQGSIDLSPVATMAVLSLVSQVLVILSREGRISVGIIAAIVLSSVWSALSFILGFFMVILILSFIEYLTSQNSRTPFWRIIHSFSQPIFYRINRIIFRNRIVSYRRGIITAILTLILFIVIVGFLVNTAVFYLVQRPF
ncbi:YggT family protein [Breznakiellaceae bacterium SP9]